MKIALMFCFGTFFGLYIASTFKTYADTNYISDSTLTLAGSLGAICNGGSRLLWGSLLDIYSFRGVYGIVMII
jgi:hypothetical protein